MEFLYLLESIRNPVFDVIMQIFTALGNELLFMVFGMLMFWCIDKRQGYFIFSTGFFGVYVNQFLKITCRIPRPWVLDPDFTIVESARAGAEGYSFPSGHTQMSVGCYGGLAMCRRERWVRITGIVLAVLIPFSRMYLGVHTPLDVSVSILVALVLIFVLWPLFSKYGDSPKLMVPIMSLLSVFGVGFALYMNFFPFPADTDPENFRSALENSYKFLGCIIGMWCIYWIDRVYIHFDTRTATIWGQVLKLAFGFPLLVLVMEGSKPLFEMIFNGNPIAHTLRYLLTVLFAGSVWPLTFRWFAKVGLKKNDL